MWSKSFRSMIKMCLQKDPNKRPTCQELLAHKHFRPLASEDGRAEWKQRTKQELCDVVEDSGNRGEHFSCSCKVFEFNNTEAHVSFFDWCAL